MKSSILTNFDTIPYFTTEAVKQFLGDESITVESIRKGLYRWMKTGEIIQLKKGVYMTRRFYETHRGEVNFAAMVSAILIPQSYLSLEYILQRQGILTEVTYPVTAITSKQTRVFENKVGTFTYRNIKTDLYRGFSIFEHLGVPIAQASLGKALFDFFYLRPWDKGLRSQGTSLAESLRLNITDLPEEEIVVFETFVNLSGSRKMEAILDNLREHTWQL